METNHEQQIPGAKIQQRKQHAQRKTFRDVQRHPRVAFIVDDLRSVSPWRPRMLEVRGQADILADGIERARGGR